MKKKTVIGKHRESILRLWLPFLAEANEILLKTRIPHRPQPECTIWRGPQWVKNISYSSKRLTWSGNINQPNNFIFLAIYSQEKIAYRLDNEGDRNGFI